MARQLVLWGPPIVRTEPGHPDYVRDVGAWVEKAADVGVTKIISALAWDVLPEAAHKHGVPVYPYLNYTAFPTYGIRAKTWAWSLDFLRIPPDRPAARPIADSHRPIYDGPTIGEEELEPFAADHPEYWSLTRDKRTTLEPGERRCMSLAFPEVRANQTRRFLDALDASQTADGIQVEFVLGNEDKDRASTYGYEDAVADTFRRRHRTSPSDIPNTDPDWLAFRASYVTDFLRELRDAVKRRRPEAKFTTTMIAGEPEDYLKVLQDWPDWVEQGIVDELYVWWRTDSDLKALERQVKQVADVVDRRCPFVAELSCYHPGSFQTSEQLLEAARVAKASGADAVGVYRSHSIEQLGFWPVLEQMAKL
ncbi:MAG: family 10 glycosylhydrolase [Dehalococcoidia bacterium]|jgi:hypothetical protein|nr:family 10 glycosylhydrolase [Dehalococcoidia bacterium]